MQIARLLKPKLVLLCRLWEFGGEDSQVVDTEKKKKKKKRKEKKKKEKGRLKESNKEYFGKDLAFQAELFFGIHH